MSNTKAPVSHNDFLIRGSDYLAKHPDFELIGREENMRQLAGILMRKNANNALISGPGGVGLTALAMGLQASKDKEGTPFDIVGKRFYWLDVDGLFSSGDPTAINEGFQRALKTLSRSPDTVLVVDDMKDFVEAARNNGCTHLINSLMREVRTGKFQSFIEVRDEDLDTVLKCHSDMREIFTLHDVNEPVGEELRAIAEKSALRLSKHHGIVIAPEAISAAIELTSKYRVRDMGLSRAQPERTMTLLDRALTSYRLEQHAAPPGLRDMEARLKMIEAAQAKGVFTGDLADKSPDEVEAIKLSLETDISQVTTDWTAFQGKLRSVYKEQRDGEELLRTLEDELQTQKDKEAAAAVAAAEAAKNAPPAAEAPVAVKKPTEFVGFAKRMNDAGFESETVQDIRRRMSAAEKAVIANKEKFTALTATHDKNLVLDAKTVLTEFSTISGIPADKLSENEREKLLGLEDKLSGRVFGQEEAVRRLSDAVITSRIGKKRGDKPPSFMFIGASGVGKTEIAKALAEALLDDEKALLQFDMSEYMEK
ncbi:MAG: AAA family ATPase, partial [Alphaproteobacteria bacterium]|nr:AAA family ATPase [Alphaproteobacteria bacterium]